MSDARLRELERLWRRSGALEDEVAYLRARVQVADLTTDRLELAVELGSEAANVVLGRGATLGLWQGGVRPWADRIQRLGGRDAVVRVLVALATALAKRLPEEEADPARLQRRHAARRVLDALELWLTDPNPRTRKPAARLSSTTESLRLDTMTAADRPVQRVVSVTSSAARALATGNDPEVGAELRNGVGALLSLERDPQRGLEPGFVVSALVVEVVPWALGHADPVRVRIQARREGGAAR